MKRCFRCGEVKPSNEFYCHAAMADGHLGKCKDCTRADVAAHRKRNIDKIRAYDRSRAKRTETKARISMTVKAWRKSHPEGHRAQCAANNALRDGRISRAPERCPRCSRQRELVKHHPDYSQPLLIEWMYQACHKQEHETLRRA
jgi:hypothetical protein